MKEEKKDSVSMTPCFLNTPSNSSQVGSLSGTGSLDPLVLSDAIRTHHTPVLNNTMYKKEWIAIQSFGGEGNLIEECHIQKKDTPSNSQNGDSEVVSSHS